MTTMTPSGTTGVSGSAGRVESSPLQTSASVLDFADGFINRHIGPSSDEIAAMLASVGFGSLDALTDAAVPREIRLGERLNIPGPRGEAELLSELKAIASKNRVGGSWRVSPITTA